MEHEHERRFFELRADPDKRELSGVAVRYGDVATLPGFRERFEPGAFGDLAGADIILNRQHERGEPLARTGGGGLTLADGEALHVRAVLPETRAADDVLTLIRSKVLRGLSLEFRAITERFEQGVRIISRAALFAIAVVDQPAYGDSLVNIAARMAAAERPYKRWLR